MRVRLKRVYMRGGRSRTPALYTGLCERERDVYMYITLFRAFRKIRLRRSSRGVISKLLFRVFLAENERLVYCSIAYALMKKSFAAPGSV